MQQDGSTAGFLRGPHPVGTTATFAEWHFIANVTSSARTTITSVANGVVSQNTDGYFMRCDDAGGAVGDVEITIAGKLLLQTNTSQTFQTNVCFPFDKEMSHPSLRIWMQLPTQALALFSFHGLLLSTALSVWLATSSTPPSTIPRSAVAPPWTAPSLQWVGLPPLAHTLPVWLLMTLLAGWEIGTKFYFLSGDPLLSY